MSQMPTRWRRGMMDDRDMFHYYSRIGKNARSETERKVVLQQYIQWYILHNAGGKQEIRYTVKE